MITNTIYFDRYGKPLKITTYINFTSVSVEFLREYANIHLYFTTQSVAKSPHYPFKSELTIESFIGEDDDNDINKIITHERQRAQLYFEDIEKEYNRFQIYAAAMQKGGEL